MHIRITVRVSPESRGEMIDTYGAKYREFRAYVEQLQAQGVLPREAEIHWILESGRWD